MQQAGKQVIDADVDAQRGRDVAGFATINYVFHFPQDHQRAEQYKRGGDGQRQRRQLQELAHRLDARMQGMAQEIARIDFIQKAQLNMDATFDKWAAGRFVALSPAARCYASLEELRWGALGDYCRNYPGQRQSRDFMQMVVDRATKQLATDAGIGLQTSAEMATVWLTAPPVRPGNAGDDLQQALSYLADRMDTDTAPFVNSATQQRPVNLTVPLIAQARRIAGTMTQEVFSLEVIDV